jgi:hypothetical protein
MRFIEVQVAQWRLIAARDALTVAAREGRVTLALQAERAAAHEDYDRQVRDACLGMED